MTQHNVYARYL